LAVELLVLSRRLTDFSHQLFRESLFYMARGIANQYRPFASGCDCVDIDIRAVT
jgi:hypothetical protein